MRPVVKPLLAAVLTALLTLLPAASQAPDDWIWPGSAPRQVLRAYLEPAHDYGPGHRGIDISAGARVRSPADGVIAFRGTVVDRPLLTIDHGDGYVSTLEPVRSDLSPGDAVRAGEVVGFLASGGHAEPGALHVGVRRHGEYIDPLPLFGAVPRAVLLPCCAPL